MEFSQSDKEKIKLGKEAIESFLSGCNTPDKNSTDFLVFILEIISNKKYSKIWNKKN